MTKARRDGLYLMLLGGIVFLLMGVGLEYEHPDAMIDFGGLYYPARCLILHGDPYSEDDVLPIYRSDESYHRSASEFGRLNATRFVYQPTALSVTVPFALLPWRPAHVLWMGLSDLSLICAAFLAWDLGADYAPIVSGALIGFLLANCEVLAITGNAAAIAISLCVVGVWCFLRQRLISVGVLCFALSLTLKPHDTGLVWLYFLLAGGVYRKRALQTLVAAAALGLPALLWVWRVSPHWIRELSLTLSNYAVHGGINDPGPTSPASHGLNMMLDLQAVISFFRDDSRIYNPVSYLICGLLLILWIVAILRFRPSPKRTWLALGTIAPLTLLPIYHHLYDAKLLLLSVPTCAMLWAEGGLIGRAALLVNTAGIVLTGDLTWTVILGTLKQLHLPPTKPIVAGSVMVQIFPAPLVLLVVSIFYLWVYVRNGGSAPGDENADRPLCVHAGFQTTETP